MNRDEKDFQNDFNLERDIAYSLTHPFIISLLGSFKSQTNSFLVFEYVNGPNLTMIQDKLQGDLEACRLVTAEVFVALEYIHTSGIIYRDLKPENIMVNGRTGHIKMIDFGLSRYVNSNLKNGDGFKKVEGKPVIEVANMPSEVINTTIFIEQLMIYMKIPKEMIGDIVPSYISDAIRVSTTDISN